MVRGQPSIEGDDRKPGSMKAFDARIPRTFPKMLLHGKERINYVSTVLAFKNSKRGSPRIENGKVAPPRRVANLKRRSREHTGSIAHNNSSRHSTGSYFSSCALLQNGQARIHDARQPGVHSGSNSLLFSGIRFGMAFASPWHAACASRLSITRRPACRPRSRGRSVS